MTKAWHDQPMIGTCDICDGPWLIGSDDHNGETGNHYECEASLTHQTRPTLRMKYERFNAENPWVFRELERLAFDLRDRGIRQYGIAALFEVLRYQHTLRTNDADSPFKLSNSYRAFYARDLMAAHPGTLRGFFVTRPSVADGE